MCHIFGDGVRLGARPVDAGGRQVPGAKYWPRRAEFGRVERRHTLAIFPEPAQALPCPSLSSKIRLVSQLDAAFLTLAETNAIYSDRLNTVLDDAAARLQVRSHARALRGALLDPEAHVSARVHEHRSAGPARGTCRPTRIQHGTSPRRASARNSLRESCVQPTRAAHTQARAASTLLAHADCAISRAVRPPVHSTADPPREFATTDAVLADLRTLRAPSTARLGRLLVRTRIALRRRAHFIRRCAPEHGALDSWWTWPARESPLDSQLALRTHTPSAAVHKTAVRWTRAHPGPGWPLLGARGICKRHIARTRTCSHLVLVASAAVVSRCRGTHPDSWHHRTNGGEAGAPVMRTRRGRCARAVRGGATLGTGTGITSTGIVDNTWGETVSTHLWRSNVRPHASRRGRDRRARADGYEEWAWGTRRRRGGRSGDLVAVGGVMYKGEGGTGTGGERKGRQLTCEGVLVLEDLAEVEDAELIKSLLVAYPSLPILCRSP
ncbi:hypothetical protein C8R44DRAFT_913321 [Mycena epipterygia]|nr:hypothetical protein C8R44DRAFT_913321 [Mycena epipterygia]